MRRTLWSMVGGCLLLGAIGCDHKVRQDSGDTSAHATYTSFDQDQGGYASSIDRPDLAASMSSDARGEEVLVQGVAMLLFPLTPEGTQVTSDYECVGDLEESAQFLEVIACWHEDHGWLDAKRCVHTRSSDLQAHAWDANPAVTGPHTITPGDTGVACEREQLKMGFWYRAAERLNPIWEVPLWLVYAEGQAGIEPELLCERRASSSDATVSWVSERFEALRPQLSSLIGEREAAQCDAVLFKEDGTLNPWMISQLKSPDDEVDISAGEMLVFAQAVRGQIDAVRSVQFRRDDCELALVWGRRAGDWSLLGVNESLSFTSTRPFGEGPLDIAASTCTDLNQDGSPELWFYSGYETMGGWVLMDMGEVKSGRSRMLHSRYTGD